MDFRVREKKKREKVRKAESEKKRGREMCGKRERGMRDKHGRREESEWWVGDTHMTPHFPIWIA